MGRQMGRQMGRRACQVVLVFVPALSADLMMHVSRMFLSTSPGMFLEMSGVSSCYSCTRVIQVASSLKEAALLQALTWSSSRRT